MTRQHITRTNQPSKGETPLVSGILQRAAVRAIPDQDVQAIEEVEPPKLSKSHFHHDFSQIPVHSSAPPIQPQLNIGAPGDKYEQEADRVAQDVVQRIHSPLPMMQRHKQGSVRDEPIQMSPFVPHWRPALVQRLPDGEGMAASPGLEASIQRARGSGQPLAASVREPMEREFGADFSRVRVHTDATSDQLNQSIQAKAFTTGSDIFFRQGAYVPLSRGGQELIAHELTHVVQQNGNAMKHTQIQTPGVRMSYLSTAPCVLQAVWQTSDRAKADEPTNITIHNFEELRNFLDQKTTVKNYQGNSSIEEKNKRIANLNFQIELNHFDTTSQKYTQFSIRGGNLGSHNEINAVELGVYIQRIFNTDFDPVYSYHVTGAQHLGSVFAYGLKTREQIARIRRLDVGGLDRARGEQIQHAVPDEMRNSNHVYAVSDTASIADYAGYYTQHGALIVRFNEEAVAQYIREWKRDEQGGSADKRSMTERGIPSKCLEYIILTPEQTTHFSFAEANVYKFLSKVQWLSFTELEKQIDAELDKLVDELL